MANLKRDIQLSLIGNLLREWCKQQSLVDSNFLFSESFCSGHHAIRFSTTLLESIFPVTKNLGGYWRNGHYAFYEIQNNELHFRVVFIVSKEGLNAQKKKSHDELVLSTNASISPEPFTVIREWDLSVNLDHDLDETEALNQFAAYELLYFENELRVWANNHAHKLRSFPDLSQERVTNTDLPEAFFIEGAQKTIISNQYERNPEARKACIAIHGTACKICGIDFGLVYGEKFTGKIEVHHVVPLHQIGHSYRVNPSVDLIPVCPNCHMIIHSNPNQTYTPQEVKRFMMNKTDI